MTSEKMSRPTWKSPDFVLLATILVLLVVGLNMVYSASYVIAHNDPSFGSDSFFVVQQGERAAAGLVLLLVFQSVDYHVLRRASVPLLAIVVVLLVAVLATHLSHSAYGAQRWIKLGPLPPVEPSEVAKLGLILYYADWLSKRRETIRDFATGTLPFGIMTSGICALVILQPDLGTTVIMATIAVGLYFVAGADIRHLMFGLAASLAAFVLIVIGAGYRSQRIAAFFDASSDPLGIGWNITQAQIALGSGGLFGLGLGASRQKFYYLPNAHTDAIFAVIGEELGYVGTVIVVVLFVVLAIRGCRIAMQAPDAYGSLLATGITFSIVAQAFINIGVITATIPFTGVPLPFVSFGGSSLMVSLLSIGILLNISRQSRAQVTSRAGAQMATARPAEAR
jgi:cell division protein FtsW